MGGFFTKQRGAQPANSLLDSRIYCSYKQLVSIQSQAQGFNLLPHANAHANMTGRHRSLFRGRGLNFEELKHYQAGDDIRNIDWKTTIRLGKPYVRSYTEEKDREVLILVDQRSGMFFSSQSIMKSVIAAEIAALCAWQAIKQGDRIGFVMAEPHRVYMGAPCRSQPNLLAKFRDISAANQRLNRCSSDQNLSDFSHIVQMLKRLNPKTSTLILISDWHDATEKDLDALKYLQQRNDVLSVLISDPFEQQLPEHLYNNSWVIGDGEQQMHIGGKKLVTALNHVLFNEGQNKRNQLQKLMAMKQLPLIELDTAGAHLRQFKQQVGGRT